MSEIIEGLWIGGWQDACDIDFLNECNIKCVVSMCDQIKPPEILCDYYHNGISHYVYPVYDHPMVNIEAKFADVTTTIARYYNPKQKSGVLVHCWAGISRSTTAVIAFLLRAQIYKKLPSSNQELEDSPVRYLLDAENKLTQVIKYIETYRPIICPNTGFHSQLISMIIRIESGNIEVFPDNMCKRVHSAIRDRRRM